MTTTIIIILVTLSLLVWFYLYNKKKEIEYKLRMTDKKLGEYYYESINHRNDGWSMKHYRELYQQRLKQLKDESRNNKAVSMD